MQPLQATPVAPPPRRRRAQAKAANRSSKLDENGSSSASDSHSADSKDSLQPDSHSEGCLSFASTADASLEDAVSESELAAPAAAESESAAPAAAADDSGDSASGRGPRAPADTHSFWRNDYFVLTDNRNYPNMRMRVQQRWTGPGHFGSQLQSKTLVPAHFGDSRESPDQIVLVLKAWMLHRWLGNEGKFVQRRSRRVAWERERDALARDVRARGGRESLHANALAKIQLWAPSVLGG